MKEQHTPGQRYSIRVDSENVIHWDENEFGGWVRWDDYDTLKAENETLRARAQAADGLLEKARERIATLEGGKFGDEDRPPVMVYTAKLLKDQGHHEYETGFEQVVLFGAHQRALDAHAAQFRAERDELWDTIATAFRMSHPAATSNPMADEHERAAITKLQKIGRDAFEATLAKVPAQDARSVQPTCPHGEVASICGQHLECRKCGHVLQRGYSL